MMNASSEIIARELADEALVLAEDCLEKLRRPLELRAKGDRRALVEAAEILRRRSLDPAGPPRPVQHLAFSLITSVFQQR